jgi:parvulin-like peptidyl-prolyl isomerase
VKSRLPGLLLILVIAALAVWSAACNSALPDGAVAKVGETLITAAQFDAAVAKEAAAYGITEKDYPDIYKQLQTYVAQNLVANELAAQEATKLGLSVTDADVQTELDNYVASYYSGDQTALETELTAGGLTLDDFKTEIKDGLLRDKVKAEVVKDITTVDEEKIKTYYYANQDTYYVEPSRGLRHILIKPVATGTVTTATTAASTGTTVAGTATTTAAVSSAVTDSDWAKALATAQEVRRKLAAGGDWTALAAQYSGDFATKDKGGDLGTVLQGEQIKEFEEAAFALELNELSQPIKTVYGYEIIQATAVTKGGQQTLDEVRSGIESQLLLEAQSAAWDKWLAEKEVSVGVIYRDDLKPEPTTTTTEATTTTLQGATTTVVSSETTTTVKP